MSGKTKNTFEVNWRIGNFYCWLQTRYESLYSPQFLAESLRNTRWKLKLSPNIRRAQKCISLSLQRDVKDDGPEQMALSYELSFLAGDGSPLKSKSYIKRFASKTVGHELQVKQLEIQKENENNLPEDVLTVRCKLWKSWSAVSKRGKCSIQSVIGARCIELEGTIDILHDSRISPSIVNFMSPSTEIRMISFFVELDEYDCMKFQRIAVECECFRLGCGKLYIMNGVGHETLTSAIDDLSTLLTSNKACVLKSVHNWSYLSSNHYIAHNRLKLKLAITFNSSVTSENVKYEFDKSLTDDEDFNLERLFSSPSDSSQHSEPADKSCDMEGHESTDGNECSTDIKRKPLPFTTFKEDLTSLYNDRLFCDTKLQTDTETFTAHRCVLSARSTVFKKMFTTDMKERAGECINIPDISSDTVRRMLQFLYTDCIGDLDMQSAKDLYIASDKYDIASLKQRCSFFMKKNLCPSNVCEVLVLADMHQDRDLESAAQDYVLAYDDDVFGSTDWKLFMQNCSFLAAQVMYLKCIKK